MPLRLNRRPAALLAALALTTALSTGLTGCAMSYNQATVPASASMVMPEAQAVGIDAKTSNGRIVIVQDGSVGEATVSAEAKLTTQDRADRFTIETTLNSDGTLVVRPVWPDGKRLSSESCNLEITAPSLHAIVADTSNGSITLKGGAGLAQLETSNGAVRVEGREGEVRAHTSNGRIEITGGAGVLDLKTSNGAIRINGTSAGPDDAPFRWRASTSNGSISLDLVEPVAGRIRASTSNGKASIERKQGGGESRRVVSASSIDLGDGPGEIILSTSNGSITVRTP